MSDPALIPAGAVQGHSRAGTIPQPRPNVLQVSRITWPKCYSCASRSASSAAPVCLVECSRLSRCCRRNLQHRHTMGSSARAAMRLTYWSAVGQGRRCCCHRVRHQQRRQLRQGEDVGEGAAAAGQPEHDHVAGRKQGRPRGPAPGMPLAPNLALNIGLLCPVIASEASTQRPPSRTTRLTSS